MKRPTIINTFDLLSTSYKMLILSKLFRIRIPLFVAWSLTYHCNYNCLYCGANDVATEDLDTATTLSLIDEMSKMGTKFLLLSGGEPLLRNDIGVIVEYSKKKGFFVSINTNGSLIPDKAKEIENVDSVAISLDGPADINDSIRGNDSYKNIIEALKVARSKNWKLKFSSVLSEKNIDYINYILDMAKKFNIPVFFQPARVLKPGSAAHNALLSPEEAYRKAIRKLITYKVNNNPFLGNSLSCLKHLLNWPKPTSVPCVAGKICCKIENNGIIKICGDEANTEGADCKKLGFENAFNSLRPSGCLQCWSPSQLEINFIYGLRLDSALNALKSI